MNKSVKSVLCNYLGYLSHVILSIIATPIILHSLGNTQYGIWSLVMSMTGYYGLLNFGVRSALTKYLAEYQVKKQIDEMNRLICSSLVFFSAIAIIILLISITIAYFFETLFLSEGTPLKVTQLVIILVGANVASSFLFAAFDTVLVAFNRFDISNFVGIISSIVRTVLIVCVLKMGHGLLAMAVVIISIDFVNYCVITFCSKLVFPNLQISYRLINLNSINKLFHFGIFNFMRHISRVILDRTDVIIIGIFLGPSLVAIYSIAESLIRYVWSIVKGIARVILPVVSGLHAEQETEKIEKIMLQLPKYILAIAVFIFIQFYFFGNQFLLLWLGKGFHDSYVIFCLLMSARIGMMLSEIMTESVVGMGHNKFFGYLSIIEAICNILISLFLVKKMGLIGIALGTVIPLTISRSFIIPLYCCRRVSIPLSTFFKQVLFPTVATSIPVIIFNYFFAQYFSANTFLKLIAAVSVMSFVSICIFSIFLEKNIKGKIRKKVFFL